MKSPESTRFTLLARLSAAAGILLGNGHRDSCAAVREASEILAALPPQDKSEAERLEGLRAVRQWHYDQYYDFSRRAKEQQKKSDSRMFQVDSRDAFERAANAFLDKANVHLRNVRLLNELFPAHDKVK